MFPNNSSWPYDSENAQNIVQAILSVVNGTPQIGPFENGSASPYDNDDVKNIVQAILQLSNGTGAREFAYYFTTAGDTGGPLAPDNAKMYFSNDAPENTTNAFSHAPGADQIDIKQDGVYRINFTGCSAGPSGWQIKRNGGNIFGSVYSNEIGKSQNNGHLILALNDGDILTMETDLSASLSVILQAAGTTDPSVVVGSLYIEKLS